MMRPLVALVLVAGCAAKRGALLEPGEPGFSGIATEVSRQTGCDPRTIVITTTVPKVRRGTAGFRASLCRRDFDCVAGVNRHADVVEDETSCLETMESAEKTVSIAAVDRLSIETGCPIEEITLLGKTAWLQGKETAYRLEACAKVYVCTTDPAGKTECKVALSSQEPARPPPAPEVPPVVEAPPL